MDLASWVEHTAGWPPALVYAALFAGAFVEYVFPPFPGDTVVLVGAGLVGANDWPVAPVAVAATAGSVAGAAVDLAFGRWIADGRLDRLSPANQARVEVLVGRFRRHGAVFLVVNRFVPGVRASFFVAAGIAGLSTRAVLGWATVSAVAWNALLGGVGWWVGQDLYALAAWFGAYQRVAWVVVGVAAAIAVIRVARR